MNFIINTKTLQSIVNKVIRGASNNKLLPITSYINIDFKDGTLSLTTTDMTNYITVEESNLSGENFNVVISADKFSKLVAKTTTENVTLELTDSSLVFKGNGTYNIEIPLNEEGNPIKFPMYSLDNRGETVTIKFSDIKSIINYNKSCLATDMSISSLTNYYCDDKAVISADTANICINELSIVNEPVLISASLMNLLGLFNTEDIAFSRSGEKLIFTTPNMIVYGIASDDIEDFPSDAIMGYLDAEFISSCEVNKTTLLNVIDRMSLFLDDFDQCKLILNFTKDGIVVSNEKNTAIETIPYIGEVAIEESYNCIINSAQLKGQITSLTSDVVEIHFAHSDDICIKFVEENVTKITALVEE